MKSLMLKYILYPWLFMLAAMVVAPITYGPRSSLMIFIVTVSVVIWSVSATMASSRRRCLQVDIVRFAKLERILRVLFWFYISCAYFNFFVIEKKSLFKLVESRELANVEGISPSVLGGITAILASAPVFYLSLKIIQDNVKGRQALDILLLFLVGIPPLLFSGGRNPLVLAIFFMVVVRGVVVRLKGPQVRQERNKAKSGKTLVLLSLVALLALFYVLFIAVARRNLVGNLESYAGVLETFYNVTITPVFTALSQVSTEVAVAYTSLYYYITHGVVIFDNLLQMEGVSKTLGLATFPLYVAIADFVFGTGLSVGLSKNVAFPGSYLSLFGGVYQDFGVAGLVVIPLMLSLGILLHLSRSAYGPLAIFWFAFLAMTMAIAPIYSITSTGFGSSMLFLLILLSVLDRVRVG